MNRLLRLIALPLAFLIISCEGETQQVSGAELLKPFKQELKQALQDGLKNGLEEAVNVCAQQAPEIAESYSNSNVTMGRASDRLRNRNNKAPDWVQPVLEGYLLDSDALSAKTLTLADNRTG